ncbi:MAG TPA: threonine/serine exporter family protein [Anaerovoracaceae bacterium]|nr:threonine/serine exporter family protein [Anaerovoracaceae bacterium]
MITLKQFVFAFFATAGFTLIFNIPRRHIFFAAFSGASGWVAFQYIQQLGQPAVIACFIASCLVAALGEAFARIFKEASLIFIIPGILPLVPGAGMYRTMLSLLQENLSQTAEVGTETLMLTGAIAVGILMVSSFVRAIRKIIN